MGESLWLSPIVLSWARGAMRRFRCAILPGYGLLLRRVRRRVRRRILSAAAALAGATGARTRGAAAAAHARIGLFLLLVVFLLLLTGLVRRTLIRRRCAGTLASRRGAAGL